MRLVGDLVDAERRVADRDAARRGGVLRRSGSCRCCSASRPTSRVRVAIVLAFMPRSAFTIDDVGVAHDLVRLGGRVGHDQVDALLGEDAALDVVRPLE